MVAGQEAASPSLQGKARDAASRMGPQVEDMREGLEELNTKVSAFIREKPGACLLGALAVGFLIGRIASR